LVFCNPVENLSGALRARRSAEIGMTLEIAPCNGLSAAPDLRVRRLP
jgi:hypothetical protein